MVAKRNVFKLSEENFKFVKLFYWFGVLPVGSNKFVPSLILITLLLLLTVLRYFYGVGITFINLLFYWDLVTLLIEQFQSCMYSSCLTNIISLFAEIDSRIVGVLGMSAELKDGNLRFQRKLIIVSLISQSTNLLT